MISFFSSVKFRLFAVLLMFIILAAAYTFPLILNPAGYIRGIPTADHGENYWNLWWVHHWATTPDTELLHTDYVYYPEGTPLGFHALCFLNGLIGIPLMSVLPISAVHNLLFFASFFLTGFAVYLLARQWGASDWASCVVGIWLAFSSYRFGHWHHMNLFNTQWLIFYLWSFSRLVQKPTKSKGIWCGLFLITVAWSSWYYLLFASISSVILLISYYRKKIKDLSSLALPLIIASTVFLALFSPYLYQILKYSQDSPPKEMPIGAAVNYSVDVISLFIPKFIWEHLALQDRPYAFSAEIPEAVFPHPVLYFFLILLILNRKKIVDCVHTEWLWLAGICTVFSLGPILKFGGLVSTGSCPALLPGFILSKLPLMSQFRVFDRFLLITYLSLMIFIAPHLELLLKHLSVRLKLSIGMMKVLTVLASLALAWHGTIPMVNEEPDAIFQLLARSEEEFAIVEVPFGIEKTPYQGQKVFHQTVHGKKIVNGALSRIPRDLESRMRQHKIIAFLLDYEKVKTYCIDDSEYGKMREEIQRLNLRYIILHPERMQELPHNALRNVLIKKLGASLTVSNLEIYRMPD